MTRALKLFLPLALMAGCLGSRAGPQIDSFTATPAIIHAGQKTTLAWQVSNATSLSIDNEVGAQTGQSVDVSPAATTTYTLTATGAGGSATAQVMVSVGTAIPKPVITAFTASPNEAPVNGSTTLTWTVTAPDAHPLTALSVTDGASTQDVTAKTSAVWALGSASSYMFTLTATNDGGSVTRTALVTTHSPSLHVQYTDPTSSTAKIKLVRNASSTANRLVLDVKVGAAAVTAFGFAMNIPLLQESNGMVALDGNLTPVGLIGGGAINVGVSPVTGAVFIGGAAMPNVLSMGVAKRKNLAGDGDDTWAAGATLFSIAFTMTGSAADGHGVFLGATAMADPKFRAAALTKAGAEAVSKQDIAIGDFVLSL